RAVQSLQLLADGAGYPVLVAQHLEDCSADQGDGVRFKLDVAGWVELIDALNEADDAGAYEILSIEAARQAGHKSSSGDLHQIGVVVDELNASIWRFVNFEVNPRLL